MYDRDEIIKTIETLNELMNKLSAFQKGNLLRGAILPSNEYIDDLIKRLHISIELLKQNETVRTFLLEDISLSPDWVADIR